MSRVQSLAGRIGVDAYSLLGFVAIVAVAAVILGSYTGQLQALFSGSKPELTVIFADSKTLKKDDPVRVNGVNVGEVKSLEPTPDGRGTKAVLTVDESAGTIYRDARAEVVWRSLLGGAFAVNVDPGRSEAGPLGDRPIPANQTSSQVELDDVTTVVEGDSRDGLQSLVSELSETMKDRDTLGDLAGTLEDVSPDVERGLSALRGQHKDYDLQLLISEAGKTADALDAPNDDLRTTVQGAAALVTTTAAREAELRTTFARAPGVMRDTNITLDQLEQTLDLADPLVADLREPAPKIQPALARLRPVTVDAAALLDRAEPLLASLRPAVRSLATASRDARPLLDELQPSLDRLDQKILPYMNETDPETKRTAAEMVGPALGGLGNVAAQFDQNGHFLRFPASSGSSPLYLPCQVYLANPDKAKAIECESLNQTLTKYLTYNPLKPPTGTAEDPPASRRQAKKGGSR